MRFRMLHTFAWIQIVLGIFLMVGAAMVLIGAVAMAGYASGSSSLKGVPWLTGAAGIYIFVGLFLVGLQLGAIGQFCLVVIQIEENTRP